MPTTNRNRNRRSRLNAVSDEHRSALYDTAKQRMKDAAQADSKQADAIQQKIQQADDQGTRKVHEPVERHAKPAGTKVNQQEGNPREGRSYQEKKVPGGVRHVYGDGTSVFVRKTKPKARVGVPSKPDGTFSIKGVARKPAAKTGRQQALERVVEARKQVKRSTPLLRTRKRGRSS